MEHWGIYVAFAWTATIVYAFVDAVHAIRGGRSLNLNSWSHPVTMSWAHEQRRFKGDVESLERAVGL
jgi:hypothetical protein